MYFQKRNCAASVLISTFMCLWAIYIFSGSAHFPAAEYSRQTDGGIYKRSQTHECGNWDWGWPCNSFSGNFCFEFSVLCLCSAVSIKVLFDFVTGSCYSTFLFLDHLPVVHPEDACKHVGHQQHANHPYRGHHLYTNYTWWNEKD
jgi:hypothetical protein